MWKISLVQQQKCRTTNKERIHARIPQPSNLRQASFGIYLGMPNVGGLGFQRASWQNGLCGLLADYTGVVASPPMLCGCSQSRKNTSDVPPQTDGKDPESATISQPTPVNPHSPQRTQPAIDAASLDTADVKLYNTEAKIAQMGGEEENKDSAIYVKPDTRPASPPKQEAIPPSVETEQQKGSIDETPLVNPSTAYKCAVSAIGIRPRPGSSCAK
jgi:hypothetical protein